MPARGPEENEQQRHVSPGPLLLHERERRIRRQTEDIGDHLQERLQQEEKPPGEKHVQRHEIGETDHLRAVRKIDAPVGRPGALREDLAEMIPVLQRHHCRVERVHHVQHMMHRHQPERHPDQWIAKKRRPRARRLLLHDAHRDEQQRKAQPLSLHPLLVEERHQAQAREEHQRHEDRPDAQRIDPRPPRKRPVVAALVHLADDLGVMGTKPLRHGIGQFAHVVLRSVEIDGIDHPGDQHLNDAERRRRNRQHQQHIGNDHLPLGQAAFEQPGRQRSQSHQQQQAENGGDRRDGQHIHRGIDIAGGLSQSRLMNPPDGHHGQYQGYDCDSKGQTDTHDLSRRWLAAGCVYCRPDTTRQRTNNALPRPCREQGITATLSRSRPSSKTLPLYLGLTKRRMAVRSLPSTMTSTNAG